MRAPSYESDDAQALVELGAVLIYEFLCNVDALVKGLANAGK